MCPKIDPSSGCAVVAQTVLLTADEVRLEIRRAVAECGTQREWARTIGVSAQYVSDVLSGHREPSGAILRALGLQRVVQYSRAPVEQIR